MKPTGIITANYMWDSLRHEELAAVFAEKQADWRVRSAKRAKMSFILLFRNV